MRYLLGIPYVNRTDLLVQALDSVSNYWDNTIVIDNSPTCALRTENSVRNRVSVYEPPVPLTLTQSMNYLYRVATENSSDVVMYMHVDAEAHPGTPEKFLDFLEGLQSSGRRWGVTYTFYDTLAAYNVEAIRRIGPWDTTFPNYFMDNDYYYRMRLAGYELVESGLPVTHHQGSATINSDPKLQFYVGQTWEIYAKYYALKWGGAPGHESYSTPFNR